MLSGLTRRQLLWWLAAAVAVVAGIGLAAVPALLRTRGPVPAAALEKLDVYGELPDFSLIERSGRRIGRADLLGKVSVLNFIYTKCTETCPTQSLQVAGLQREFAEVSDLRLVSITVDPRHDTPAVLAEYAARHGADPGRWWFLTGDKRAIYCLATALHLGAVDPSDSDPPPCERQAWRGFERLRMLATPRPAFATHGSEGLVMHSARFVLVDRAGRVRAYHLATDPESLKRLRPNLRALLAERRKES